MNKKRYQQNNKLNLMLVILILLAVFAESFSYKVHAISQPINKQAFSTSTVSTLSSSTSDKTLPCHMVKAKDKNLNANQQTHQSNHQTSYTMNCCEDENKCSDLYTCELDCNHCLTISFVANIFTLNLWQTTFNPSLKIDLNHIYIPSPRLSEPFRPPIS